MKQLTKFKEVQDCIIEVEWHRYWWHEIEMIYWKEVLIALCMAKQDWQTEIEIDVKEELLQNFHWEATQEWIDYLVKAKNKAINK